MKLSPVTATMLLAALLAANPAGAETLPEAMANALDSNPSLASARAQVASIRQSLPLAWAEALPQVSVTSSANQVWREERTFGTTIREQPEYWIATLNTSMLLFGSGRVLATARQARAQIASAVASYQNAAQELLLDVARAYGGVTAARTTKAAQEELLANLQEQVSYVSANVREGFLTQTDLAQAQARMEQARAELAQADVTLVQASEHYMRLVGHPPGELEDPGELAGLPADLSAALLLGASESPTVVAAQAALQSSDAAVSVAAAQGRPRVTFEAANAFFETMDQPNIHDAGEDTLSIRLSIPIFAGGSYSARTNQQRANRTAARYDVAETQNRVRERVAIAWAGVIAARAGEAASGARVRAAELAQRGMQREQQAGQRSTIDVLNQEQELLTARVSLANAERDYDIAQRELAASVGRLTALSFEQPEDGALAASPGIPYRAPPPEHRGGSQP